MKNALPEFLRGTEKPIKRPEKRFQELSSNVVRRESGRYGGKSVEKGKYVSDKEEAKKTFRKREESGAERKSVGFHTELPAQKEEFEPGKLSKLELQKREAERYRELRRLREEGETVNLPVEPEEDL